MYFPISDVTVSPIILAVVGFLVGLLGGFFGVGGGFLAGPLMFLVGVPMNFVVGTDLAHMIGKSIVAARHHRVLGHVDTKLGLLMVLGTVRVEAQVTILHVVDVLPSMYAGLEQMEEPLAELLQSDSGKSRELRWAAQVVKAECEISEIMLRRGIVADELLREARDGDYDLIVLGSSKAAGGLVRVLMGDTNRKIVTRAERPVLVVRPRD